MQALDSANELSYPYLKMRLTWSVEMSHSVDWQCDPS